MSTPESIVVRAPGRVCLFGEHQDYLGLPVIAAAIDRHIVLRARRNGRDRFRIEMPDIGASREIRIDDTFPVLEKRDYFASALRVLRRYGCIPTAGYDVEIHGTIPINAGASSSSAVVVAWVRLLLALFGAEVQPDALTVARLAYESEVKEHGEPGGMMDHYSISLGGVIYIDTAREDGAKTLAEGLAGLVLADSRLPKDTVGTLGGIKQNTRRCLDILAEKVPGFRLAHAKEADLPALLKWLPDEIAGYFLAAVGNHACTRQAYREFRETKPDLTRIGTLMNRHHAILRNHLKLSVPKIDRMIEAARDAGALGAKINGSGGGGSIVVLAPGREAEVVEALQKAGAAAYPVRVAKGVMLDA